jgi:putative transposase
VGTATVKIICNHSTRRTPAPRKRLNHTIPSWVPGYPIFMVTVCCAERGRNQLANDSAAKAVLESLEHRQKLNQLWIHLLLLMPDHLHCLASFSREHSIQTVLANWKRYVARKCGIRWQEGFHDHRIRSEKSLAEKSTYILSNPVRAGLATHPDEWLYVWSSERFAGRR